MSFGVRKCGIITFRLDSLSQPQSQSQSPPGTLAQNRKYILWTLTGTFDVLITSDMDMNMDITPWIRKKHRSTAVITAKALTSSPSLIADSHPMAQAEDIPGTVPGISNYDLETIGW
ncbi:hypothetical protein BASA50_007036 [Batrachochytrium salamandrivorans]|uniref:Uncharacterized protein n=1 Tax=Batrachochytrium salamandrivorans TaxID=1357716 RepID=A0ABQ8F7Y3_9FUNG|nr:hypothetical protein BASA50_007036 [Batrachochytrium salamandrivorans]